MYFHVHDKIYLFINNEKKIMLRARELFIV